MNDTDWSFARRGIAALLALDLEAYREAHLRLRVENLVRRQQHGDVQAFLARAHHDEMALADLRDALTVNTTEFFRNPVQFEALRSVVLPALLAERPALSIWSAGCSFGAEPFSIAMVLDEIEGARAARHRIVATDMGQRVLERATHGGPYFAEELRGVTPARLARYFRKAGASYRLTEELRARITFRQHNLLGDPVDRDFDLVSCRNVAIYFEAKARDELLRGIHDVLRPGGVLFVGGTEAAPGSEADGWRHVVGNFYRRIERQAGRRVA